MVMLIVLLFLFLVRTCTCMTSYLRNTSSLLIITVRSTTIIIYYCTYEVEVFFIIISPKFCFGCGGGSCFVISSFVLSEFGSPSWTSLVRILTGRIPIKRRKIMHDVYYKMSEEDCSLFLMEKSGVRISENARKQIFLTRGGLPARATYMADSDDTWYSN